MIANKKYLATYFPWSRKWVVFWGRLVEGVALSLFCSSYYYFTPWAVSLPTNQLLCCHHYWLKNSLFNVESWISTSWSSCWYSCYHFTLGMKTTLLSYFLEYECCWYVKTKENTKPKWTFSSCSSFHYFFPLTPLTACPPEECGRLVLDPVHSDFYGWDRVKKIVPSLPLGQKGLRSSMRMKFSLGDII